MVGLPDSIQAPLLHIGAERQDEIDKRLERLETRYVRFEPRWIT